jgi:hypothetical protein
MGKLAGLQRPPKARQAYQQFMSEEAATIAEEVKTRWSSERAVNADGSLNTKSPDANFRSAVARDLFKQKSTSDQEAFKLRAVQKAKDEKEAYEMAMKAGPSKSPEARQK